MSKINIGNIIHRFLTQNPAKIRLYVIKKQSILCVFFLFETSSRCWAVILHIIYRIINQL